MSKRFLIAVVIQFLIFCLAGYILMEAIGGVVEIDNAMKAEVGKEVTYKGEQVEVVDYSSWDNTYTLSDGSVINRNYYDNKLKE